jgi:preprotein translocase subunit YajC
MTVTSLFIKCAFKETVMKYLSMIMAGSALMAAPALAQDAATTQPAQAGATAAADAGPVSVTPGTAVVDASGAPVGTIESVTPQGAVVSTGTAKAALPLNAFAKRDNGVAISMSKAELEAAVNTAKTPQIEVGAVVNDTTGGKVGTVESISGDQVTVATANAKAALPKNAFAQGPNGLVIAMTATQLEAAVKAATPKAGAN